MVDKKIKKLIHQLKTYQISVWDIPEELRLNADIIKAERKFGLRQSGNRGFDVIRQEFFIEEEIFIKDIKGEVISSDMKKTVFEDFESYYKFLEGDIYENACYRFYDYAQDIEFIEKNKVNITKLKEKDSFVTQTIDDFTVEISEEEWEEYKEAEKTKALCKKWIAKFDLCKTYEELYETIQNYRKSRIANIVDVYFFLYNYLFKDIPDKDRFQTIMQCASNGANKLIYPLCSIYDPDEVIRHYTYSIGSKGTRYKRKRRLKEYVEKLKKKEICFCSQSYFDETTHFFCEKIEGKMEGWTVAKFQRYFETFEEFITYRKGDLKACDLSNAIKLNIDFTKYDIDERTRLPLGNADNLVCSINKVYQKDEFYVEKQWRNASGCLIKKNKFSTPYFFDFVYFLKNDLSDADLLFCDGLAYITASKDINFDGAKMTSQMCDKFNVKYEPLILNQKAIESFKQIEKNEEVMDLALKTAEDRIPMSPYEDMHSLSLLEDWDSKSQRVYYITDLHLMHRLANAQCRSKNDVIYVIQKIVESIVNETGALLLIGGDIASDFEIFKLFISILRRNLDDNRRKTKVVFILGNHELWDFDGKSVDEIAEAYRELIEENGMYFLQNDLLYMDSSDKYRKISYEQLLTYDSEQLREQLRSTRLVIFGGLGFSGYNVEFNADNGIYREALTRDREIKETEKFEKLYNLLTPSIYDKNVIIFTHTPKKDWCKSSEYQQQFVYVSGHTHRNDFHDDGEYRVYSDNQVGYHNENPHLKNFLMESEYDYFCDYEDGIYQISGSQYNDFYRGKNIRMDFTRKVNILYMLKKKGYYCFIHQAKSGALTILNGGAMKKLDVEDILYYYNHMDEVILYIKNPLDKYMRIQKEISGTIQKLGGRGYIHGCIIDVDSHNHIYVNPIDMTITGYWASDMINKVAYPDVPSLLKSECPELYTNYIKLIKGDSENPLVSKKKKEKDNSIIYLDTDIYAASREIKKMQKLTSNILSTWYEDTVGINTLSNNGG